MNTRQYEYILAVAKLRNFGLAAEACSITQSTLSTMIGRFEDEIGVKIFDRKRKPVTITKEGETVILQLSQIDKEIVHLKELVLGLKGELTGELKIGVIPTVAPYLLPEFLNDFAKRFHKVKFTVSEMTTKTILSLLEKRELDIGVFAIPVGHKNLQEIPLYNEPFVLYDCREKPQQNVTTFYDIEYTNFWLLQDGHCLHTKVGEVCANQKLKHNKGINFDFRAGSIDSLIRFVRNNNGATLLPYLACLDFLPNESKKLVYFNAPKPMRTIGLGCHPHFAKQKLLKELVKDIQQKIIPLLQNADNGELIPPF